MASKRQIDANRGNASRSTGPKTKAGKQRSSRNALRHGLTSQLAAPGSAELEALARLLIDGDADPNCVELARNAARAHLNLVRIREVKSDMLARVNQFGALERALPSRSGAEIKFVMRRLRQLRVHLPAHDGHREPMSYVEEEGATEAMRRLLPELHRIDRYEERAFDLRQRCFRRLTNALNQTVSIAEDDGASD